LAFNKGWIVRDRKVLMQKKKDLGTITWHEVQVGATKVVFAFSKCRLCFFKCRLCLSQISVWMLSFSCFEIILQVLVFFIILILLWFFQSPKFIPGWADQFKVSGENHSSLLVFLLFLLLT
jgi:hypothetical protein